MIAAFLRELELLLIWLPIKFAQTLLDYLGVESRVLECLEELVIAGQKVKAS
ncbi:MAG: hypothetical protein ABIH69_04465 [bacterium]